MQTEQPRAITAEEIQRLPTRTLASLLSRVSLEMGKRLALNERMCSVIGDDFSGLVDSLNTSGKQPLKLEAPAPRFAARIFMQMRQARCGAVVFGGDLDAKCRALPDPCLETFDAWRSAFRLVLPKRVEDFPAEITGNLRFQGKPGQAMDGIRKACCQALRQLMSRRGIGFES